MLLLLLLPWFVLRSILSVNNSAIFCILRYRDVRSMAPIDFDVEITSPTKYVFIIYI